MEKGRFLLPPTKMAPAVVEDHGQDAGLLPAHHRLSGPPPGEAPWDSLMHGAVALEGKHGERRGDTNGLLD